MLGCACLNDTRQLVAKRTILPAMTQNAANVHGARNDISLPASATSSWTVNDQIEKPAAAKKSIALATIAQ